MELKTKLIPFRTEKNAFLVLNVLWREIDGRSELISFSLTHILQNYFNVSYFLSIPILGNGSLLNYITLNNHTNQHRTQVIRPCAKLFIPLHLVLFNRRPAAAATASGNIAKGLRPVQGCSREGGAGHQRANESWRSP